LVLTVLESGDILGIYGHNGTNYQGKYVLCGTIPGKR